MCSCFYTIWKNFSPHFEQQHFKGVQFVLDCSSAAIIARNILFIYLCLLLPKDVDSRQKWLFAMWSIWFCHELLPDHRTVLRDALKNLLSFSVDQSCWSSKENPLHGFVTFFSVNTLQEIWSYWNFWYTKDTTVSIEDMRIAHRKSQNDMSFDIHECAVKGMHEICGLLGKVLIREDQLERMVQEYRDYLESGNAFCECVADISIDKLESIVNLTLFEKQNDTYTLHYGSTPFRCFHHSYIYSFDQLAKLGVHIPDSYNIRICETKFEKFPLLASCFQQFTVWIIGTAHALQSNSRISFLLDSSSPFHFLNSWESGAKQQFDLVFALKLIDKVSPPAIVFAAARLLKEYGLFLSSSTVYRQVSSNFNEYIKAAFGIPPSLLPLICGIRCINHEGDKYSSCVSHQHTPINIPDLERRFRRVYESTFIWKKVSMTPMCINSLEDLPTVCEALCNSFSIVCTTLINKRNQEPRNVHSCTDTVIMILKQFSTNFDPFLTKSHTFWMPLCKKLKDIKDIEPFLTSIQTQAIVHALHLHLVIDDSTCPFCTGSPISTYVGQFCIEVNSTLIADFVMIQLRELSSNHYIDCFSQIPSEPSKLKLFFFAPILFVEAEYTLTLCQYRECEDEEGIFNLASELLNGNLNKYQLDVPYLIKLPVPCSLDRHAFSIGTVITHRGNDNSFQTKIALAMDKPVSAFEVIHFSSSSLEIKFGGNSAIVKYPYPVCDIRHSIIGTFLIILAKRSPYQYEDDGQLFHVNPNDQFCLLPVTPANDLLRFILIQCQFSPNKWKTFSSHYHQSKSTNPLSKIKMMILEMLLETNDVFQFYVPDHSSSNHVALFIVLNRVSDVSRRTPAVDVYFCFFDTLAKRDLDFVLQRLRRKSIEVKGFPLYREAYELLKAMSVSFHSHTYHCANLYTLIKTPLLKKHRIKHLFKRAVIYPLYQDRDRAVHERRTCPSSRLVNSISLQEQIIPTNGSSTLQRQQESKPSSQTSCCSYCEKNGETKKCLQCHKALYWSEHDLNCSDTSTSTPSASNAASNLHNQLWQKRTAASPKASFNSQGIKLIGLMSCSYCQELTKPDILLKCSECREALYCSRQCRKNHWSEHKLNCIDARTSTPSTAHSCNQQTSVGTKEASSSKSLTSKETPGTSQNSLLMHCSNCQKLTKRRRCTRCLKVSYCGQACQRAHWKEHKNDCKPNT